MTEKFEIYKCNICQNLVEIVNEGFGVLVCCGQDMEKQEPHTQEEGLEKHLPVIEFYEKDNNKIVKIKVGEIEHPMTNEHFIRFIEAISNDGVYIKRKFLKPNDNPVLEFKCNCDTMIVREYCNIHGLWRKQI